LKGDFIYSTREKVTNLLPILTYHKISTRFEWGLTTISPNRFRRHVSISETLGLTIASLSEYSEGGDMVYFTFDDGYESAYSNAYPIIDEAGGKGSVFLISDYIGRENRWDSNLGFLSFPHLTIQQVRELVSVGWTIGSHTKRHRCLIGMEEKQLRHELEGSRKKLEDLFGITIEYLVPPFGKADQRVIETAIDCGYKKILLPFTLFRMKHPERYCLYRWNIYATDSERSLSQRLSPTNSTYQVVKQMVISFCNNASIASGAVQ